VWNGNRRNKIVRADGRSITGEPENGRTNLTGRITNIYDYADCPIDCLKGPHVKTGFVLRFYPKGWGIYNGAIQHVSKRNVFAMLDWLHEQQAKPLTNLFEKQEVFHDPNRSHNVGL